MSVVVFAGPTLAAPDIRARLDAEVLPPAAVGDLLRAARGGPVVIALIDGVFDRVLPVWHKEILWAMAQGIHVFGASSMGALRAAELEPFGMRGVGRIHAAYREGALEADDEVAVLHGPAEIGFPPVTEALVNVRATLERAVAEHVLDSGEAAAALGVARSVHYRERSWESVIGLMPSPAAHRLRDWLPAGRVDLKQIDALELVDEVAAFVRTDPPPMRVNYHFAWTDAWDKLHARVGAGAAAETVLDELQLQVDRLHAVRRAALLRLLARRDAERGAAVAEPTVSAAAQEALRARLGLWSHVDLDRWLGANGLDRGGFSALAEEEALLEQLEGAEGDGLRQAMLSELRATGSYAELAERARQKAELLAAAGLDGLGPGEAGVDLAGPLGALASCLNGPRFGLARELGFTDQSALEQAVLREHLFQRMIASSNGRLARASISAQPDSD